jgi:diketogulonate reductase-like aldo/keto reductase
VCYEKGMSEPANVTTASLPLNTGERIPQVGLGVWQTPRGQVTRTAVSFALKHGYRHVDTARIYGNETDVGVGVRESGLPRADVFVTTKLWNEDQGYDRALKAFEASLARLGMEYVDLYLIHWPVAGLRLDSWRALERIFSEKRARAIGVSNFLLSHLRELIDASEVVPAVNQIELSPFLQRRETVAFCQKNGIVVEAYSPLTHGARLDHPVLLELARRVHRSPAQVLLRWGIQKQVVVLPKSTRPERIAENADIFDFALDDQAMSELDGLEEGLATGWDPAEQR